MTPASTDGERRVRVYAAESPNGSGLVWAHGGGFAAGSLDMPEADFVARSLADAGTTVISVDYRLVGDGCRYPLPSDDLLSAWQWAVDRRRRLGVDRLALGGASAGGNLAAGVTLRLLDAGDALPDLVVLAYPTLLAVQPPPSPALRAALNADPLADQFGPEAIKRMYEGFLGGPVEDAPRYALPATSTPEQLIGFPQTLVINDDVDELRVSGEVFTASLRRAGVGVTEVVEPGTRHGHLNDPDNPAASITIGRIARRLAELRPYAWG